MKESNEFRELPMPMESIGFLGFEVENMEAKSRDIPGNYIWPGKPAFARAQTHARCQAIGIFERSKPSGLLMLRDFRVGSRSMFGNAEVVPFMALQGFVSDVCQPGMNFQLILENPSPHLVRFDAGLMIRFVD